MPRPRTPVKGRDDFSFFNRWGGGTAFPLSGTLFQGQGPGPLILVSSATAVPQGLYFGFAAQADRARRAWRADL